MSDYWSALLLETLPFFFFLFSISHDSFSSQERVIEDLREQKEREERTRLDELDQMRKENQQLKDKLTALQPPNASQSQPANPGVTQNQRLDREVGTDKSVLQNGCCVDDRRHHQYSWNIQNKIQITAEEGACSYERCGRPIKAVCLVCVLMAGIFHCSPNHNRNEQAATAPISEWPSAQRESVHVVKIVIMSTFLTDLELPSTSIQPHDTLWLFLLYKGIKRILTATLQWI